MLGGFRRRDFVVLGPVICLLSVLNPTQSGEKMYTIVVDFSRTVASI